MTAPDAIAAYLCDLKRCLVALKQEYAGIERDGIGPLLAIPREGGPRCREGRLTGLGEFRLHGVGCQVELDSGAVVDFDWDIGGTPIFDSWRLHFYVQSMGWHELSRAELAATAEWLAEAGLLDTRQMGWFAVTETI